MPTIQVQAHLSADALIDAASQLDGPELEAVAERVLMLRAERRAPHLTRQETELLLQINTPLPEETWQRYTRLYAKLEPNTITKEEHQELLRLIDVVEMDNAQRIGHLIKLAELRGTTLPKLMATLGIGPRFHA